VPEMKAHWDDLSARRKANTLSTDEAVLLKKWGKVLTLLANNPKHPGLQSHEIESLSRRYGVKVYAGPHGQDQFS